MPFIPVPNTVMAEIRMSMDFQRVENTLYFEFGLPPTPANLVSLGNDLLNWYSTLMAPQQGLGVALREIFLTDLTSVTGGTFTQTPPSLITGSQVGEMLPNNVALAVSFRTAFRGRSFRGRNYFLGLVDSQVAQNTVTAGALAAITNIYQQLPASLGGSGSTWVVVSRFTNNAPRVTGIATPVTAALIVDSTVDSQRNRLPGRGA